MEDREVQKGKQDKKIKPEALGGFPDFLPDIMIGRQWVIDQIRQTFELYGFLPLDTPCLERSSVLGTDRNDFKMEVYRFNDGFMGTGQDVTLRFDLTVPLSRIVAAYPSILKPFRRYQTGKVFRKEKPQSGRFREFTQFDADIVGSDSVLADAEIIMLMHDTLKNLGIDRFVIRFNNRKILNGLPKVIGFPEEDAPAVFRVLDKLDKVGLKEVMLELQGKSQQSDSETCLSLNMESLDKIRNFLNFKSAAEQLIAELKVFFKGISIAEEGISEIENIIGFLRDSGISEDNWKFDLSIARGLGYYTGPVFETTLIDIPEIGSVFSGGRYDELVMRFLGEKFPATGASVGVDRLITALDKLKSLPEKKSTAKVLVSIIDENMAPEMLALVRDIRKAGINAEIYLGKETTVKTQVIYTAKRGIPYMIIYGENEKNQNKYILKDMINRKEYLLTRAELFAKFQTTN